MARAHPPKQKPVFHAPMAIDWTEEKLRALDQDQLLNLLGNLDLQRASGRLREEAAEPLERQITALLTPANARKRRKRLERAGELAVREG
jgi:hypothetical protein